MLITITPLAIGATEIAASPDIVWNGTVGDFSPDASRGLASTSPLESAVLLALFTDAGALTSQLRHEHKGDFRGWPGDAIEHETLGSRLWLFRRHELTDMTAMEVRAEILRALQPIIDQGAAARVSAEVTADKASGRLVAEISLVGRDGGTVYSNRFDLLWRGR